MTPDLVYLVHEAENELLRHSLRSIDRHADGMYRKVWIVGVLPTWARNVEHIPLEPAGEKFADIRKKVTAAMSDKRVAANVVIMNDDHIATGPVSWDAVHMGSTAKYLAEEAARGRVARKNTWIAAVENTAVWMADRGYGDIDCFEGHVPLMFSKAKLRKILADYPVEMTCDYPGFYPEAGSAPLGRWALNAKIGPSAEEFLSKIDDPRMPGWVSTNDAGWREGMIGGFIRGMYREPSRFEEV